MNGDVPLPLRAEVEPGAAGQRVDRWLAAKLPAWSRSRLQSWIRDGRVRLDGAAVRANFRVAAGQVFQVDPPGEPAPVLQPLPIPLEVLYEDEHLLVIVKPAGLMVHPGAGPFRPTLVHALLHRFPAWRPPGPPERPGIVHRLDRDTSGLLLVARTPLAWRRLGRQIMAREVTRRYIALAWGRMDVDSGWIEEPIGRDPRDRRRMAVVSGGRPAVTGWQVLRRFDTLSLLDIVLRTGRTHQIRVHLAHAGHPVFADPVYGGGKVWLQRVETGGRAFLAQRLHRLHRQALHAYHLAFRHPVGGERMRFEAALPADLDEVLTDLTLRERGA